MKLISTIGEQRTLALCINGVSPATVSGWLFDGPQSLDAFFRSSSWGQCWFTGDVVPVSINMPLTCEWPVIAARANGAAMAKVDMEQYTRRMYWGAFPCGVSIGSLGYMTTPGGTQYSSAWINTASGGAWIHEMGHCMNFAHAGVAGGSDRGDPTDAMGAALQPFNAPHRVAAWWIAPIDIYAPCDCDISPMEFTYGVRVVRIHRPSTGDYLYLSYRQGTGFYPTLTTGVHLHAWRPNTSFDDIVETRLIDTHPGGVYQALDAPMVDGQRWSDPVNGINVEQISHGPEYVTVRITFGQAPPPPPVPPVTVEPETAMLYAGQFLQFEASEPVRWTVDRGEIDPVGLYARYIAPSRLKKPTTATVTATSLATGGVGSAVVNLVKW